MAGAAGQTTAPLAPAHALMQALAERPEDFELFAALRLLERAFAHKPRLGRAGRASDDPVRLGHAPSLAFAPRSIAAFRPGDDTHPPKLDAFVLGLFGPNGPLPLHLTEYAIDRRINSRDSTLTAFADIFHHRILSLFYRAWADAEPTVHADRPDDDRYRFYIGALIGLASARADDDPVAGTGARAHGGRMLSPSRNPEGLRCLLESAFREPVQVIEFVAEWLPLPDSAYLRLGRAREVAELGRTCVMGALVRSGQQRFRLRIGPLDHTAFRQLLPGGDALRQLHALVRSYVGDEQSWDVQLVLRAGQVPTTRLGIGGRMGLDTWMGQRSWDFADADDVTFQPIRHAARASA